MLEVLHGGLTGPGLLSAETLLVKQVLEFGDGTGSQNGRDPSIREISISMVDKTGEAWEWAEWVDFTCT